MSAIAEVDVQHANKYANEEPETVSGCFSVLFQFYVTLCDSL